MSQMRTSLDTKIYTVTTTNGSTEPRLVKATTKAQAIRHAARSVFDASLSTQNDLVTLLGKGVAIEDGTGAGEGVAIND